MGTLLPCGSHHTCFFGKVLFTSPVNTQTHLKTDLLHSAFPPLSQLSFLTRDQAGISSPFFAKNFLAGSQSHMQGPIPCADFQPLPGACHSQSHKRSQMRACTSATRSIQPSQEAVSPASCRPVPLALLPQSQLPGHVWHLPDPGSPPKTPPPSRRHHKRVPGQQQGRNRSEPRAPSTAPSSRCAAPRPPGRAPAMSGSDRSRADPAQPGPARGRPCPLDAQVALRCLMGSGCLQEPLTPRQGESSNKRL